MKGVKQRPAPSAETNDGAAGIVYVTAIVQGNRRALVAALTVAETERAVESARYRRRQRDLSGYERDHPAHRPVRRRYDSAQHLGRDVPPPLSFAGSARAGILFLLVPGSEDDPQMTISDLDGAPLLRVNHGGAQASRRPSAMCHSARAPMC